MSEKIFELPDVGEGLVEAEIVEWKVAVGDVVSLNQPLVDIETAKAVVELPSPYAGVVRACHGEVGDVMTVGSPLFVVEVAGDTADTADTADTDLAPADSASSDDDGSAPARRTPVLVGYGVEQEDTTPARRRPRASREVATPAPVATNTVAPAPVGLAPRSTPPVRLYAKQHGLDIATVTGTGRDGLVTREDVERALTPSTPTAVMGRGGSGAAATSRFVGRDIASWRDGPLEERIPVTGVLRSMSEAMVRSAFTAPHAAVWVRVDATRTVDLLASLASHPALAGVRVSPLTVVAMAMCDGARHYPGINSSFDDEAHEVVVRRRVNLGIAANTPRGLIVPNVKGADQLDLASMAAQLNELVDRARAGTTTPEAMAGTTLTITNVGPFAVDGAVPVLPPGTGAIVAVGRIAKAPWVVDDQVVVRHVVELSMSFDHRQIDGALASQFIAHVGRFLEDPALALLLG